MPNSTQCQKHKTSHVTSKSQQNRLCKQIIQAHIQKDTLWAHMQKELGEDKKVTIGQTVRELQSFHTSAMFVHCFQAFYGHACAVPDIFIRPMPYRTRQTKPLSWSRHSPGKPRNCPILSSKWKHTHTLHVPWLVQYLDLTCITWKQRNNKMHNPILSITNY